MNAKGNTNLTHSPTWKSAALLLIPACAGRPLRVEIELIRIETTLTRMAGEGIFNGPVLIAQKEPIHLLSTLMIIASHLFASDLVFLLSALYFNLLLVVFFVAQRNRWIKAARAIGILWLLLAIPFALVFARYLAEGKSLGILVPLALVLFYILVEFLLDFVIKVEFRCSWKTHVPYIVLEYIALFSLIRIAFSIDRAWGYLVSITFWILLASLIYLFSGRGRTRKDILLEVDKENNYEQVN